MSATINLTPQQIKPDDLGRIFELFCESFDIRHFPHDTEYWKTEGLKKLRESNIASYTLHGCSIFRAEYSGNGKTTFNGCSWIDDPLYVEKMKDFIEALKIYEKSTS